MTADTAEWPYDADQHDPLTALRIPVVRNPFPRCRYEVCLVIDSTGLWGTTLRPTGAEVRQITAYLEWLMYHKPLWKEIQRQHPFDTDYASDTVVLIKPGVDDWCCRRRSWRTGPPLHPARYDGEAALDLEHLLDQIGGPGPQKRHRQTWQEWKTAHPEAFGEDAASTSSRTQLGAGSGRPTGQCRQECEQREECPLYECCAAVGKPAQLGDLIQRWKEQADAP